MAKDISFNLASALRKLKHHREGIWCACLTPSEILALIADRAQIDEGQKWVVEHAQKHQKSGITGPNWFYCKPGVHKPTDWGK